MARIRADGTWHDALLASAWRLLPLAFVAAVLTCVFAYRSEQEATSAMVWAEEPVGVVWE